MALYFKNETETWVMIRSTAGLNTSHNRQVIKGISETGLMLKHNAALRRLLLISQLLSKKRTKSRNTG